MDASWFENPRWYLATTLKERVGLLSGESTGREDFNEQLAQRKLQQWHTQAPFTNETIFSQRLGSQGISDAQLRQVLGEPAEAIRERFPTPPRWLADLTEAFSLTLRSTLPPLQEFLSDAQFGSLLRIIHPIISYALTHLNKAIQVLLSAKSDLAFDPSTIEGILYESLAFDLLTILSPTAALELNVARLEGLLAGDTPEQRYQAFVEGQSAPAEAVRLLREYPVLARLLVECANRWVDRSFEFLQRLCQDWRLVQSTLCEGCNPGVLVKVDSGAGDRHNDGRSVMIATFSSGFRTVYKPRSLSVDVHFQELLLWLNNRGVRPEFKALNLRLDRIYHDQGLRIARTSAAVLPQTWELSRRPLRSWGN
jgi:class II lanthipeptide synthase